MLCCDVLLVSRSRALLSSCRRCIADDGVGGGVVAEFAHGVNDGADDVHGCRTGIASRIDLGELGQVIRVVRCSNECAGGVDARDHVVVLWWRMSWMMI